ASADTVAPPPKVKMDVAGLGGSHTAFGLSVDFSSVVRVSAICAPHFSSHPAKRLWLYFLCSLKSASIAAFTAFLTSQWTLVTIACTSSCPSPAPRGNSCMLGTYVPQPAANSPRPRGIAKRVTRMIDAPL